MFIVTVVFLVGLVFVVQQILLQYSYINIPSSYQESDYHIMISTENMITKAVTMASSCSEASKNIEESLLFVGEQTTSGYSINVEYYMNCTNWNNAYPDPAPVPVTIKITSENTETINKLVIYSGGAIKCKCSDWVEKGCGSASGCDRFKMRKTRTCEPSLCDAESICVQDYMSCGYLQCRVTASGGMCSLEEVDVLHMSSLDGSGLAEILPDNNFNYKVCCQGPGIGRDCTAGDATTFLDLESTTNARVEIPGGPNFNVNACISGNTISCGYTTVLGHTCDDFNPGSACIVSISSTTNANVANCTGTGSYDTKICCLIT